MNRRFFFLFAVVLCSLTAKAQTITVNVDAQPLNQVLIELRDAYQLRFSYDNTLLAHYRITAHKKFHSAKNAIRFLLKELPLQYDITEGVFVIYPLIEKEKATPRTCLISGYILEKNSEEPLPFSTIRIDKKSIASDISGYFSGQITCDSSVKITLSHLGYYLLDTVVKPAENLRFYLRPASINLQAVEIRDFQVDYRSQIGQIPGVIKLNSNVASRLPGYGDNSVFNLLRLQPGILAAGEQTNELIIWGSYSGQSKVEFDGFTVYGLKNFNDNISSFNPLMAKDIEVMKGGFDARYGERVGGIVNITGKNGNTKDVSFTLNVNNMTINSMVEIPVRKRSSLIIAFRHTYFNLYNPTKHTVRKTDENGNTNSIDIKVVPNYVFRDLNLKYSGKTKSGDLYYVSLYSGNDDFSYKIDQPIYFRKVLKQTDEQNLQFGGSLFYGKSWKNGWSENFIVSASSLKEKYYDHYRMTKLWNQQIDTLHWVSSLNQMTEFHAHTDLTSPISRNHVLEWGGGLISNQSLMNTDTFGINKSAVSMKGARLYSYLQDKINLGRYLTVRAGGRVSYANNLKKNYFEPRFSVLFQMNEYWKLNFATGIYHQFIAKTSVLDDEGNYRYLWAVCDNKDIPVLKAVHNVLSLSAFRNDWTFSAESYYKVTTGLSRFVTYKNIIAPGIYHGNSRSYGLDLLIKKDFKGSSAWVAYSLGKTEEHFEYFPDNRYRRAPQDQRQEVKLAVIINLNPVFISANYVYGTGFPVSYSQQQRIAADYPYSRLDGSVSYRFLNKKLKGEAGLSVLNILNTENIKFSNFERIPLNQTSGINIYAQAIPFTPTLYLNIRL